MEENDRQATVRDILVSIPDYILKVQCDTHKRSEVLSCSVYGCTNNSLTADSNVLYHSFPKNIYSQQWVVACGWQDTPIDPDTAYICSVHFEESAYNAVIKMVDYIACYSKALKYDAVPTLYLPQTHIFIKESPIKADNLASMVVYTLASANDGTVAGVSLQSEVTEKEFFRLEPSSSTVKLEMQNEIVVEEHDEGKYNHIKTYPDLYVLQAHNKSLRRKIEMMEAEAVQLGDELKEKEREYEELVAECKQLEFKIANKHTFSQQEQKVVLSKVFSESQIKILFGKKKVAWSNDDMAVGYTIRHLSSKRCYAYLTKTLNIPLPAISSIKRWITTKKTKKSDVGAKQEGKFNTITE